MKKGDKVIITKISDDVFNGFHPNYIDEGFQTIGIIDEALKVGERFRVLGICRDSGLLTSKVTEIISENIFKTENSTYKLDLYENN